MDFDNAKRFCEVCIKEYLDTRQELNKLDEFIKDYSGVKSTLSSLLDRCSHGTTVPFGRYAFMFGDLVHTNDVLVLLGNNWFAERSVKQTVDIVDRRIQGLEDTTESLKKRMKQLTDELSHLNEIAKERSEAVEIIEPYDEDYERQWNVQHEKKVREFHQKSKSLSSEDERKSVVPNDTQLGEEQKVVALQQHSESESDLDNSDDSESDVDDSSAVDTCSENDVVCQRKPVVINFHHSSQHVQMTSCADNIETPADVYTQLQQLQHSDTVSFNEFLHSEEPRKIVVERFQSSSENTQDLSSSSPSSSSDACSQTKKISKFKASRLT